VAAHVDASRRRPRSTQYATSSSSSSSSSSGVDDGRCDDGEFALDSAEVTEEAAAERKEVRRVRPLLSELQVPEWQELAKDRGSGEICQRAPGYGDSLFFRHNELGRLRKDTALTNRGPR
jgi:hypothetical protein